jgi:DNA-binding transcriptional LysR family regulator
MNPGDANFLVRHASLRQLQIVETVARLGGYTRAAEALHLSQPTVFIQVKKLSDVVGLPLFERSGKTLHPTHAGLRVLAAAEDVLDRLGKLHHELADLKSEVRGELRVAVVTTGKYFVPHLLGAFMHQFPGVEPHMTVTNRAQAIEHLTDNQHDLIIMGQVPDKLEVDAHPFLDNKLVVVAGPEHPLARMRSIPLRRLAEERFLLRERGSGTRLALEKLFAKHGVKLEPYMELGSSEAIKQAVMGGLGISVLSSYALRLELARGHLVLLNVQGFPLERRWHAVHLRSKQLSLVARSFLDFLLEESDQVLAEFSRSPRR